MKRYIIAILAVFMIVSITNNTSATYYWSYNWWQEYAQWQQTMYPEKYQQFISWKTYKPSEFTCWTYNKPRCYCYWKDHYCCKPPVSAPLDGGFLAILAVAGMGYYLTRKKKSIKE